MWPGWSQESQPSSMHSWIKTCFTKHNFRPILGAHSSHVHNLYLKYGKCWRTRDFRSRGRGGRVFAPDFDGGPRSAEDQWLKCFHIGLDWSPGFKPELCSTIVRDLNPSSVARLYTLNIPNQWHKIIGKWRLQ